MMSPFPPPQGSAHCLAAQTVAVSGGLGYRGGEAIPPERLPNAVVKTLCSPQDPLGSSAP